MPPAARGEGPRLHLQIPAALGPQVVEDRLLTDPRRANHPNGAALAHKLVERGGVAVGLESVGAQRDLDHEELLVGPVGVRHPKTCERGAG